MTNNMESLLNSSKNVIKYFLIDQHTIFFKSLLINISCPSDTIIGEYTRLRPFQMLTFIVRKYNIIFFLN